MKRLFLMLVVLILAVGCATGPQQDSASGNVQVEVEGAPDTSADGGNVAVGVEEPIGGEIAAPEKPAAEETAAEVPSDAVATDSVMINRKSLDPETITVSVGSTVTWKNLDDRKHLISGKNNAFRSPGLLKDDTFSYTFEEAGTYEYVEAIFGINGVVVVQ